MMIKKITALFAIILMTSSCVGDKCKTCELTSYVVIGGQIYNGASEEIVYCGEELQEFMDIKHTVDTVTQEGSGVEAVQTTFITCY